MMASAHPAHISARSSRWITHPAIDFINSLCPVGSPSFPEEFELLGLADAFEIAFRKLEARWRADFASRADVCTKSEPKVLAAIERKTLAFGKLAEKMPRRLFTEGELDPETGELRLNHHDAPVLKATGIDDRNLDRSFKGLVQKGMITRVVSTPHPTFGSSSIYSIMPLGPAATGLLEEAIVNFALRVGRDGRQLSADQYRRVEQLEERLITHLASIDCWRN